MSDSFQILATRSIEQNEAFIAALQPSEHSLVSLPLIQIEACSLSEDDSLLLERLSHGDFDYVLISSPNGVRFLNQLLDQVPATTKIAVQGAATAKAFTACFARTVDFMPSKAVSENFAADFSVHIDEKQKLLFVSAKNTRGVLQRELSPKVAEFSVLAVYETIANQSLSVDGLDMSKPTVVPFFSPSAVQSFLTLPIPEDFIKKCFFISIGPITTAAIEAAGFEVAAEALEQSSGGVVDAIFDFVGHKSG